MRDETKKDHTIIKSADVHSFGVTCAVVVDSETQKLSKDTLVCVTFVQACGDGITHELTIPETIEFQGLLHKCLSELEKIAQKQTDA